MLQWILDRLIFFFIWIISCAKMKCNIFLSKNNNFIIKNNMRHLTCKNISFRKIEVAA